MDIAIIGGGVSGLGAAWALSGKHAVTLYEREARLGGHANTVTIDYDGVTLDVDTGFVVFNDLNYPQFSSLLRQLNVQSRPSDMSFSVSDATGYEWSSNGLRGLFAWKRNLSDPTFLRLLADIAAFGARARTDLRHARVGSESLGEYVDGLNLSRAFLEQYLLPMGGAIWSTPEQEMLRYPAAAFLQFFDNHRLLQFGARPVWRTIDGGSRAYVERLRAAIRARFICDEEVVAISRSEGGIELRTRSGYIARHDGVVVATHSDEALALLDATAAEQQALNAIRYAPNTAFLHRDPDLMPHRRAAWASWNYLRSRAEHQTSVCVTYWMNALQGFDNARPLFVTLNPPRPPRAALTFATFTYNHPQFDAPAIAAQRQIATIQGANNTWFAGAWLGHGFHEDGLSSGLRAAALVSQHFARDMGPIVGDARWSIPENTAAA